MTRSINLVFLYISDFHVSNNLSYLKRDNTIVVLFTWDDRLNFNSTAKGQRVGIVSLAKQVDLVLNMTVSPLCRYVRNEIAVLNWNSLVDRLLPYCQKNINLPPRNEETVLFFGNNYGYREKIINYLVARNIPLQLYGEGWGSMFLPYDKLWEKIPQVSLNLGISSVGYTRTVFSLKGRDFEVPGAGGLYLVNRSAELLEIYQPNNDILSYKNLEECYSKCADVLANPAAYELIRLNGYQTANRYNWPRRVEALKRFIYMNVL